MIAATPFSVLVDTAPDLITLRLQGECDIATESALAAAVEAIEPSANVLVDLSALNFLAASSVHILVAAKSDLASHGGDLRVCGADALVLRVLEITGTEHLLARDEVSDHADSSAGSLLRV